MENDKPNSKNTSPQKSNLGQGTLAHDSETLEAKWNRLKRHVTGPMQLTELEGRLLTNDSEALGLNPALPTYPPPIGVAITQAVPVKTGKVGKRYMNS